MKKKTNISDKTLKLISDQQIKPIAKWEFVAKNWALWLIFWASLMLLVLGTGVSWFGLADNLITPYWWMLIATIFLYMSFVVFEKTKRAYRFPKWQVMVLIGVIGLTIGAVIYKVGIASKIDRNLDSRYSLYRQMVPMKMTAWNNPKQGFLSGEIISIKSPTEFQIKDFENKEWDISGQNPVVKGRVQMVVGKEIKLIGNQTGTNTFKVDEIRPWNGMGQNKMKEN